MPQSENKYGFQGRLTEDYPSQIIIDVTNICNLHCLHCPQSTVSGVPGYKIQHIDVNIHAKLIHDVANNSNGCCQYIRYTAMGEPLLHPQIFDMLDYAKQHSGTSISLTTNGTLLHKDARQRILQSVDVIDISLDALSKETYAAVRRGGNHDNVYANVQALIAENKAAQNPLRVVVTFIEQTANAHETEAFKHYWENAGADYVIIRRLHSCAGQIEDVAVKMHASSAAENRYPCLYPWERLTLAPEGTLGFCPANWTHQADFAHFSDTTIAAAWKSDFMTALREAHTKNYFSTNPLCAQCPDWSATRWPHVDRSFADMISDFRGKK